MNIFTFTKLGRAVVLAVVMAVGTVWLLGCEDSGANSGGGGGGGGGGSGGWSNNCGVDGTAGSCKTVTIGGQTWMAENLNYQTENSRCYKNNSSYCNKYGRLYMGDEAKTVCPSGWHLPSDKEWEALETAAGGSTAGKALKSKTSWASYRGITNDDTFGFLGLPGGKYNNTYIDVNFFEADSVGYWWSATNFNGPQVPYYWRMHYEYNYLLKGFSNGSELGYSVRCVAD